MLASEGFQRDCKLHRRITVGADKLVVVKTDHVALVFGDDAGDAHQFARLVREHNREGEDPVSLDQAMLHNGGHRDDIHVTA